MNTPWRDHFWYWILPGIFVLALILAFFSGNPVLASIIAPAYSREFGLLESTQHLLLLVAAGIAFKGLRQAATGSERLGFGFLMFAFTLLFLEEINYGEFYWRALNGLPPIPEGRGNQFNLHNQISTSPIKSTANLVLLLFFVILPLAVRERAPAWLRYVTPPRILILTVLVSVLLSQLAHTLDEYSGDVTHALGSNIAEFRETFIYYIGLMYAYTLVWRRRWPGWRGERGDLLLTPPR
jgi:hypothetical protein